MWGGEEGRKGKRKKKKLSFKFCPFRCLLLKDVLSKYCMYIHTYIYLYKFIKIYTEYIYTFVKLFI